MLPTSTFGPQLSFPPQEKPFIASFNRDQIANRTQVPLLRDEQHLVPQRRSSRKGGAYTIAPAVDKTPASKPPGDHGLSQRVPTPKVNSATAPLKVRKTRENKATSPIDSINPPYPKNPRTSKAVLSVTVTASPEVESFDLSKAGNIWAAIQIRGEMFIPEGAVTVDFDEHHDGFNSHLRNVGDHIAYERSISDIGQVTNVFVYIKPGEAVTIEGVVGDLWYPALLPGQIVSLLVKINVKALATPTQSTSSDSLSRSSLADSFAHVELMLGEVLSELLKIEVVYSHSYFPEGTSLSVHESCWLLRTDSMLGQSSPRVELRNEQRKSFIRRLLAFQLSSGSNKLEKALRQGDFSVCENYLCLLKEELPFVATDDNFVTHVERKGPPACGSSPRPGHFSLDNRHITYYDMDKRSPDADSPATIIHNTAPPTNEFGVDAAQKIWRHIRKHSKTRHELDQMAAEAAEENEEIKEIKQRALKNKRSVGADTIRSLTLNINDAAETSWL